MKIVTAAQGGLLKSYETTIRLTEKKCAEFGYSLDIFDLGNLGFGTPVDDSRMSSVHRINRIGIKPELILRSMNDTYRPLVVWVDGDASLIGRIDEVAADDSFDVGVTVRPKRRNKKTSYINAGVLFFKNNDVLVGFQEAGPDMFISPRFAFRRAGDPKGKLREIVKLGEGRGATDGVSWGDYSGSTIDGDNLTDLWTIQSITDDKGKGDTIIVKVPFAEAGQ